MNLTLGALRRCFEGAIPSAIATCAPDGMPNVAYLSQVHYVDESHVALTYQFFNTTRKNILANPRVTVQVVDPDTGAHYRLQLEYLRTETESPLFENMKAKLAGIASHTGMSKVFRLMGSDVYRVLVIEPVHGGMPSATTARPNLLPGLRACLAGLAGCNDLAHLFDETLQGLERYCDIRHAMLLMHDATRARLYTVATRGYAESGVGSEICMGEGIIGVAARERTPIRIGYAAQEYLYSRVMRRGFESSAGSDAFETEIPFPGLPDSSSQLALSMELLSHSAEQHEETVAAVPPPAAVQGAPLTIRHFAADHSVFIDNDYLIKGVAGAIFWKLLRDHVEAGRSDFTNRELRLDPALKLPDISDNLEARLILPQRRLAERCPFVAIEKTGRGRFRLNVGRPLKLSAA